MPERTSHGTFRNPRRESSGLWFRVVAGLVGVVVLLAMITMAQSMIELRKELFGVQQAVNDLSGGESAGLREEIAALRNEIDTLARSFEGVDAADRAAMADRIEIRKALARLLHQHESGPSEIAALLMDLNDSERAAFVAELGATELFEGHLALRRELEKDSGGNGGGGGEELAEGPSDPTPLPTNPEGTPAEDALLPDDPAVPDGGLTPLLGEGEEESDPLPETVDIAPLPDGPSLDEPADQDPPGGESEPPEGEEDRAEESDPDSDQPDPPEVVYTTYTVVTGDSLLKIARKHDVSAEALAALNGISNPNLLRVGQVLKIPVPDSK